MIRRERTSVPPPKRFISSARKPLVALRSFYELDRSVRSQRRAPEDPSLLADSSVGAALSDLFDASARTASRRSPRRFSTSTGSGRRSEAMDIEARSTTRTSTGGSPTSGRTSTRPARGARGRSRPASRCAASAPRPEARGPELDEEHRLVLDPCEDEPEAELRFAPDGSVAGGDRRGAVDDRVRRAEPPRPAGSAAAQSPSSCWRALAALDPSRSGDGVTRSRRPELPTRLFAGS